MANEAPKSFDFSAHDKQFHGGKFVEGKMKCKFRDQVRAYESPDRINDPGHKPGDYSSFKDHAEDCELLEMLISQERNPKMRKFLEEQLRATESLLGGGSDVSASGTAPAASVPARTWFGARKPLAHDDSAFPHGQAWEACLANYGRSGMWHSAGSGSTAPHYIDFNGRRYFVKKAGYGQSSYTADAAQNEVNSNNFIRLAGFNAPDSEFYDTPDGQFAVSLGQDLGKTLDSKLGDKNTQDAVRDAYPLMSLLYNMDLMENSDNAYVDNNGNPVFIDNGSTFGFSARGARNKYYDFDKRDDPFPSKSTNGGLTGLIDIGTASSSRWKRALGSDANREGILKLCAKYEMGNLVREAEKQGLLDHLSKKCVSSLEAYADKIDSLSKAYKNEASSETGTATAIPSGNGNAAAGSVSSNQSAIQQLAAKYGISNLTTNLNSDGTMTLGGLGNISQKNLIDFVRDLNKSGLIPGFMASLTQGGQIQTTQSVTTQAAASALSNAGLIGGGANIPAPTVTPSSYGSYSLSWGSGPSSPFSGRSGMRNANAMATAINQSNSFPGYTAVATATPSGGWEITLYPKNSPGASSSGTGNYSKSSSSITGSPSGGSQSSFSSFSGGSSVSGSQARSASPTPTPAPAPKSVAPAPAPTPAPNINTQTPQQVAQSVAKMAPAAAVNFVNMLVRRLSTQGLSTTLASKYVKALSAVQAAGAVPSGMVSAVSSAISAHGKASAQQQAQNSSSTSQHQQHNPPAAPTGSTQNAGQQAAIAASGSALLMQMNGAHDPSWNTYNANSGVSPHVFNRNATAITNALAGLPSQFRNTVNSILGGKFYSNASGIGGVVTGANIPRAGVQSLQRQVNQHLATGGSGLRMKIHNNGGISFSRPRTANQTAAPASAQASAQPTQSTAATPVQPAVGSPVQSPAPATATPQAQPIPQQSAAATSAQGSGAIPVLTPAAKALTSPGAKRLLARIAASTPGTSVYNGMVESLNRMASSGIY